MLVLSRKVGERIKIGNDICVTIVRIGPQGVRIGIEAPAECLVVREELSSSEIPPPAGLAAHMSRDKPR